MKNKRIFVYIDSTSFREADLIKFSETYGLSYVAAGAHHLTRVRQKRKEDYCKFISNDNEKLTLFTLECPEKIVEIETIEYDA